MNGAEPSAAEWSGATDRSAYKQSFLDAGDRLADAARTGAWDTVLATLDAGNGAGNGPGVNRWRVGGRSLFTPLHQAAWHGAPVEVVARLLDHGAWRSLRDAAGKRAVDIARERGHDHLLDLLSTVEPSARQLQRYHAWDRHLASLVAERTSHLDPLAFRDLPTEVVDVEGIDPLWAPYPGMYGGFSVAVYKNRVFVESWCRVVGGSGQAHVITEHGCTLVDEGFV